MFHYPCTFHEPFFFKTVSARYSTVGDFSVMTFLEIQGFCRISKFRSWDYVGFSVFQRFGTVWITNTMFWGKKRNPWKFPSYSFLPTHSCLCFPPYSPPPFPIPSFAFLPVLFLLPIPIPILSYLSFPILPFQPSPSCPPIPTFVFAFS
jgi:hypothetical protein